MRIVRAGPSRRPTRQHSAGRVINVVCALAVSGLLLFVLAAGFGTIPPLGAALDPGQGACTSASGGQVPGPETLHLAGLQHPVTVAFTAAAVPSIQVPTDH